jgi:hypothetical protein
VVYAPDVGLVVAIIAVGLTSFRLTRLLARDTFPPLAVQRARIAARWGSDSWQAYLSECQWCAGVYVSAAVTGAAWWVTDSLPMPAMVWGGAAAIVGVVAVVVEALDKVAEAAAEQAKALRKTGG